MTVATRHDHDRALQLAASLRAAGFDTVRTAVAVGSIEQRADQVLIDLNEICLSHAARASCSVRHVAGAFERAERLIADASAPVAFCVIDVTDTQAVVRTASGKVYGLSRRAGAWHRGHHVGATISDAMRGAA